MFSIREGLMTERLKRAAVDSEHVLRDRCSSAKRTYESAGSASDAYVGDEIIISRLRCNTLRLPYSLRIST